MAKKPEPPPRPYFDVRREYNASLDATMNAANMLAASVSNFLALTRDKHDAVRIIGVFRAEFAAQLKAYNVATIGDESP